MLGIKLSTQYLKSEFALHFIFIGGDQNHR
jgi:hypothetical protein